MNQIKIGQFIQERRKDIGLTQLQLAEKLNITDRAVSKWENGRCMPDVGIMESLCSLLDISINELLSGEKLSDSSYSSMAEEHLLQLQKKEEESNRLLLVLEMVLGIITTISFVVLVCLAVFLPLAQSLRICLLAGSLILFFFGIGWCLYVEYQTGWYACPSCGEVYIPTFRSFLLAPHMGMNRYMTCPTCHKKGWQRKVIARQSKS